MTLRLAPAAGRDITTILRSSQNRFGAAARQRYEALIEQALATITASDPPSSREAAALGPGLRLYHLRNSRLQVASPAVAKPRHFVVYRRDAVGNVTVLRVLHEASDLSSRFDTNG